MGDKKKYPVQPIQKSATSGLSVDKLVVTNNYDEHLREFVPIFAKYPLKGAEVRKVGEWKELVDLLAKYKSITHLVIYFHGIPGALMLGGKAEDLDEVGEKYFKGQKMPKVGQLDLEACSVAEKPEKTVPFAKLFEADRLSAWNYFHVGAPVAVNVPSGTLKRDLESSLRRFRGYLLENTPSSDEMIRKPASYSLGAEWFRNDLNDDPLPPPPPPGDIDTRSHTFKRRSSATEVTLRSIKELGGYTQKYKDDPVRPLEHVSIDLPSLMKELTAIGKDLKDFPF